jgi:chromosome partitioning protein
MGDQMARRSTEPTTPGWNIRDGAASGHTPRVILICAPKGGVGKTTVARHLLVSAAQRGRRVIGFDFDPQRTLTKWYLRRDENFRQFDVEPLAFSEWAARLYDLRRGKDQYDLAVIDTPPSIEDHIDLVRGLLEAADLVLVPTGSGFDDLESVVPWMVQLRSDQVNAAFVLSKVNKASKTWLRAQSILVRTAETCPIAIPLNTDVERAVERGLTGLDIAQLRSEVREKFDALFDYVLRGAGVQPARNAA